MSTRRLFLPIAAATTPVQPIWIYGTGPGGIGDLILFSDGTIVLRNTDARRRNAPSIYEAYGIGGLARATTDANIMPGVGAVPTGGAYPLTFNGDTATGISNSETATGLQSALNALASITTAGGVTVGGSAGGPFTVKFNTNGFQPAFTSGVNTLTPSGATNPAFVCVVNIAVVAPGSPSTVAVQTITPSIAEGQALGLVIGGLSGTVNSSLLGTTTSSDNQSNFLLPISSGQFADLSTGAAAAQISSVNYLFAGGLFTNYYKGGTSTASQSFVLIDMANGAIIAGFTGGPITLNSGIGGTQLIAPKVFSDGGTNFGCHNIGSLYPLSGGDPSATAIQYTQSFPGIVPTGTGALIKTVFDGLTTLTGPVASYQSSGFSGPFLIGSNGAPGAVFSSGMFSIAQPVSIGSGIFMQDCFFVRPNQDGTKSGTFLGTQSTNGSYSGGVLSIEIVASITTGWRICAAGGSTGGSFSLPAPTAAQVLTAIQGLFPECACAITANTSTGSTFDVTFSVTRPSGATYLPALNAYYDIYATGQDVQGPLNFYGLIASDNSIQNYYPFQGPVRGTNTVGDALLPLASGLGASGSQICHAVCYNGLSTTNFNWIITLPGIGRINIGLTGAAVAATGYGSFSPVPVSVMPFKSGFAIALPHLPSGAPQQYAFNLAASSAATVTLSCPIIVIDAAGNPDTAFDAACYANFFSLGRSDGARFGPASLAVKGGNLCFGSLYMPTFLLTGTPVQQINSLGDIVTPPNWSPFQAPKPNLEVFCACDTSGGIVLPP